MAEAATNASGDDFNGLMDRARRGEDGAWKEIDQRYRGMLRIVCRGAGISVRMRKRVDESDVLQAAFLVAHTELAEAEFLDEAQFRSWLIGITLHKLQEQVREHHRALRSVRTEAGVVHEVADEAARPPSEVLATIEAKIALCKALDALPLEDKELILWRQLEGATWAEIAQWRGCSSDSIQRRYVRVLERLRMALTDHDLH